MLDKQNLKIQRITSPNNPTQVFSVFGFIDNSWVSLGNIRYIPKLDLFKCFYMYGSPNIDVMAHSYEQAKDLFCNPGNFSDC